MAKIYFICGFIGSGKTTYAKKLEQERKAFRFNADEWMIPLFGEHMAREVFDARLLTLKSLFQSSAIQMINLNVSVIFDFGFWTKSERLALTKWAKEHDLDFEFIYLDVSYEECQRRALQRNAVRGEHAYEMTPEMLALFWSKFERPDPDEEMTRIRNEI
ncbi:AAA family ATPase [Vibrio rhizosphaerae]|uniref:AAA family ATPase n=1 Tax=Vibrio rhizosphaerae TaxID=398736 RepID=UPI00056DE547|nr:ATP-binding protein [Vibrio rhizosphaerae]